MKNSSDPRPLALLKRWWPALLLLLAVIWLLQGGRLDHPPPPSWWTDTVQVPGQALPVPKKWIESVEGKIAHDLIPPKEAAVMIVPFNFNAAYWKARPPGAKDVSYQYWNHLCETEAGEWIVKTAENVEGFYFARPVAKAKWPEELTDLYLLEAPIIDAFYYGWDSAQKMQQHGGLFVAPPGISFHFVEEPRRAVKWQEHIEAPYVRLFGYRYETHEQTWLVNEKGESYQKPIPGTPMQIIGIPQPTAQFAYTWRGLARDRDRELGVSGIEYLIYDRVTKEILSLRRTFLLAAPNPQHTTRHAWLQGTHCPQAAVVQSGSEHPYYQPLRTLKTKEKSTAHLYEVKYLKDKK